MENTTIREADGSENDLPTYEKHLLSDQEGLFPASLNEWEVAVLEKEITREGSIAWYRNPSRPSQDSLGIIYNNNHEPQILRPDFIFFSQHPDGKITADIVDPHGTHLSDALPKLKGLALYAEEHLQAYRRIEAVAKINDDLRVLDLTDQRVREEIAKAQDAKSLYEGTYANVFC